MPLDEELLSMLEGNFVSDGQRLDESISRQKQEREIPWQNKLAQSIAQSKPGAFLLGAGQEAQQMLASIPNMFLSDENKIAPLQTEHIINPEHGGYHTGGKVAGGVATSVGPYGLASKGLQGMTGAAGLATRIGTSAGIGYAMGEQFPEQLGGRYGAAALSSLFPVTAGSTSSQIGKKVVTAAENAEAKYGGKIGESLANAAPIKPKYTSAMQKLFDKNVRLDSQYGSKDALVDFLQNPSAHAAQDAMSALKAEQRSMLSFSHPKVSSLPDGSQRTYHAIGDAIKDLEKQIEHSLSPEAFKQYKQALKEYAGFAAPYKQSAITGARKGTGPSKFIPGEIKGMEKYSQTLPKDLSDEVMNQYQFLMQQHPELYVNKYGPKALAATGVGGGLLNIALRGAGQASNYYEGD